VGELEQIGGHGDVVILAGVKLVLLYLQEDRLMKTIVNSKGQITIPSEICEQLGIKDGTYLHIDVNTATRQIILTPITREYIHSFRGKYKGKGLMRDLMAEKNRERI
jgi:AbrB family looped-hinge helix DNA binding protein